MTVQDLNRSPDLAQTRRHGEGIAAGFQNQRVFAFGVTQCPAFQLLQFDRPWMDSYDRFDDHVSTTAR